MKYVKHKAQKQLLIYQEAKKKKKGHRKILYRGTERIPEYLGKLKDWTSTKEKIRRMANSSWYHWIWKSGIAEAGLGLKPISNNCSDVLEEIFIVGFIEIGRVLFRPILLGQISFLECRAQLSLGQMCEPKCGDNRYCDTTWI